MAKKAATKRSSTHNPGMQIATRSKRYKTQSSTGSTGNPAPTKR